MKYALIDTQNTLHRTQDFDQAPELSAAKGLRWVAYVTTPSPVYDSATEYVQEAAARLEGDRLVQQWEVFTLSAKEIEANRKASIPQSVSPRQIRQALTIAGLRTDVEAAIAAADQNTKDWYEYSTTFERSNPVVAALATSLSVSDASLDGLWTLAASL